MECPMAALVVILGYLLKKEKHFEEREASLILASFGFGYIRSQNAPPFLQWGSSQTVAK